MAEILSGYINHLGSCIDGAGTIFVIATQDGPGTNDVDVVILKRTADGIFNEVHRIRESTNGKHGFCSAEVLPDGRLCVLLSERNTAGIQVAKDYYISGLATPPSTGSGTIDLTARALIKQLAAAIRDAAGRFT